MTIPSDIPHRIKRLLKGQRHRDDLPRLFEWVRDAVPHGSPVRDVGDFDAHRDHRNKGLTWEYGIAFAARQRIGLPRALTGSGPTLEDVKRAQKSAIIFARNDAPGLARMGMSYDQLKKHMASALEKVVGLDGYSELFSSPLTNEESDVYYSFRIMRSVPLAFSSISVTNELADILIAQGALSASDKPTFMKLEGLIATFAISRMHRTHLDLKGVPGSAMLEARTSAIYRGKLEVQIEYTPPEGEGRYGSSAPAFTTNCDASEWAPSMQSNYSPLIETMADWSQPLDLDDQGRLCMFERDSD